MLGSRARLRRNRTEAATLVGLLLLLAWIPIPHAGYLDQSRGLLAVASFALLLFWLLIVGPSVEGAARTLKDNRTVLFLLAGWLLFHLIQIMPLPPWLLTVLNPQGLADYRATGLVDQNTWLPISVDVGTTLKAFLNAAAYAVLFVLALLLANSRRRIQVILTAIMLVVVAEAIWGMLDQSLSRYANARASGTFHNPNHFAGFLELGLGACIGLLIAGHGDHDNGRKTLRGKVVGLIDWLFSRRLLLYTISLILIAALLQSGSRAGFFAFGASLILIAVIDSARLLKGGRPDREKVRAGKRRLLAAFALLLIVAISLGAGDRLLNRIQSAAHHRDDRAFYRQGTQAMFLDAWPAGFGAGVWPYAFEAYRPSASYEWRSVPHAHNEYLQLLAEQGLAGFVLLAGMLMAALLRIARSATIRSSMFARGVSLGVLLGACSLLIHSWWDYQFHIPANAAYFFIMLALGLKAAGIKRLDSNR